MSDATATPTVGQIYKVALAAIIGSIIEHIRTPETKGASLEN
jgi:hypothetical protein